MATHRISILGAGTTPDTSGDVFFEPYSVTDTATIADPMILNFALGSTRQGAHGSFQVPQNFVGTVQVIVLWVANATTGNAIFEFDYIAVADTQDPGAAVTESDTNTLGTDGTAFRLNTTTITGITSGNFAIGDQVVFTLFRDQADANDTLAVDALVLGVLFEYADA